MKRTIISAILLIVCLLSAAPLSSQPVVNGIMQGSPSTFMVDPMTCDANTSWARPYYGPYPNSNSALDDGNITYTAGVTTYVSENSHVLLLRPAGQNPQDPRACLNGSSLYLPIFPVAWNLNEYNDGSLHYEDTVMRIGAHTSNSKSHKMEYYFTPDTTNPVLLVAYQCVMQSPSHTWTINPSVTIQVFESTSATDTSFSSTPIPSLGYYPNDYIENGNLHQGIASYANYDWPYSRYYFLAQGSDGQYPSPNYVTPSRWYSGNTFNINDCGSVQSTGYLIVAFNLMEQARNHRAVKFQVLVRGCRFSAHYAYGYFTAKMVPGKIQAHQTADTVELSVPWGFDANTYRWKHGLNKDICANLTTNNQYRVKIPRNQLMPYYRCEMESQTGVPFVYEVRPHISEITADFSATQLDSAQTTVFQFNDLSFIQEITPAFNAGSYNVPSDTMIEPASSLRWSWKKEGSAWTCFAQDEHNPVLALPIPDHYDSIRVKLEVEDPETGAQGSVEKTFYYGSNVGVGAYASEITLYPNPNSGKFVIQSGMAAMKEVCVFDLQGRLLRKVSADGQTTAIDIKGLPSGTYMVRIETDKGIVTKTVVKQ
ncbi:MAG: T9SS type A sorting domain-containing protein [Bacteroidales bacterium]|nr:T9SS type A sorting domain-containing protein [Bacteroidales bacterium]